MKTDDPLTVAYLSTGDARDKNSSKGRPYYTTRGLENAGARIDYLEPLQSKYERLTKWKRRFYEYIWGQDYTWYHEPIVLRSYARQIDERLARSSADVVLTSQPQLVAYRDWDRPVAIYTDCFLSGMIGYYPRMDNLCRESLRNGDYVERTALKKADLLIATSDWAADTAIRDYGTPASKVEVVPRGANIECGRTKQDIERAVAERPRDVCKLLFVGLTWHRKGGDIALDVARRLNERGIDTTLTVVGCQPEGDGALPDFVETLGKIDKKRPDGKALFERIFSKSHFFIMPSRAETFGIVFSEASSFGLPAIGPKTGGVPSAIRDGRNGRTFDYDAQAMADYVQVLFEDASAYEQLALSSFEEYQTRLNWNAVGRALKGSLQTLVQR